MGFEGAMQPWSADGLIYDKSPPAYGRLPRTRTGVDAEGPYAIRSWLEPTNKISSHGGAQQSWRSLNTPGRQTYGRPMPTSSWAGPGRTPYGLGFSGGVPQPWRAFPNYGMPHVETWTEPAPRTRRAPRVIHEGYEDFERHTGAHDIYHGNSHPAAHHNSHLSTYFWFALCACGCCCCPIGLVALIYAWEARGQKGHGNYESAERSAKCALIWSVASVVLGFFSFVIIAAVLAAYYNGMLYPYY